MPFKVLVLLIYFITSFDVIAQVSGDNKFHDYVNSLKRDKKIKGSLLSIKLVNCATGASIFEYQPDLRMIPASIQKVVTTGMGLVSLGRDYTFKTLLYYDGEISADSVLNGNLYVVGGGDPSLGAKDFLESGTDAVFSQITEKLKNAGLTVIKGKIFVDDSYFNGEYRTGESVNASWEWEDIGSYYGSGVHGLNFFENTFTAKIVCTEASGINLRMEYPYTEVIMPEVVSDIVVIHKDSLPEIFSFSSPASDSYLIRGKIPASGKEISLNCALQNPAVAFEFWLRNYLISNNISVYDTDSLSGVERHLIAEIESPPLSKIAEYANYVSNNLFADAVFKNISKTINGTATFSASAETMIELLKNQKLNTQNIRIIDGSGLSRHNYVTANFMCDYLKMIKQQIPDFHNFLPSPGTNKSTLRNFMTNYSDKNRIFLKSGSMTGVLNYAGYIVNKKGETLCVTVMVNNFLCKTKDLRPQLERLIHLMSKL
ncbi:MAG: D-alanyl-D-alanine carboxypeptidase/D-alanyl-D-alanine-endopeptidase [Prevotellaceae bacterium]|jgi:D-alanyl-D-alanine carboxypeptidase/D-alanyl-D-alanine-endopeptidase (penicillin-binding protein 4)|nr:D-alanyl-D-alanine carboxypeptidase/D-alanyl-D-alanine-endopeptidase [Prevotellaceae bacterium]